MAEPRPGWYRVRFSDRTTWECAQVVDRTECPPWWSEPLAILSDANMWPLSDVAEWGERVPMPDDEPSMCDGTVRMVRGRGQSDVLLPCTKPIDHDGPCEMTELLFGKAGR